MQDQSLKTVLKYCTHAGSESENTTANDHNIVSVMKLHTAAVSGYQIVTTGMATPWKPTTNWYGNNGNTVEADNPLVRQ